MKLKTILLALSLLVVIDACRATSVFYAKSAGHIGISTYCGEALNENINMIGIRHGNYHIATMTNSFNQQSFIFSKLREIDFGLISVGAHVGLVHGYSLQYFFSCNSNRSPDILPFVAPNISINMKKSKLSLMFLGAGYTVVYSYEL